MTVTEEIAAKKKILQDEKLRLQEEVNLIAEEESVENLKRQLRDAKRKKHPLNKWLKKVNTRPQDLKGKNM